MHKLQLPYTQYLPRSSIAAEAVEIQKNNDLGYKIQAQFTQIYELYMSGAEVNPRILQNGPQIQKVKDLIKQYLGVKINMDVGSILAATLPFYSNKHHIFINKEYRGLFNISKQEAILKQAKDRTATFDKQTGKMGGLFAEYDHPVYMNFHDLIHVYNLTPGEITAVFLHEIGHIATACEYADRMETTNQVLADIAEHLLVKKSNPNLKYVYTELSKIDNKVSQAEVEKLCTGNRVIAGYYWYKFVVKSIGAHDGNQLSDEVYDKNSFEALADNFAARFGYAKELVDALTKLHETAASPERFKFWMYAHQVMSASTFVATTVAIVSLITMGAVVPGFLLSFVFYAILNSSAENNKNHTYDRLKDRYLRIRDQYVAQLKSIHMDSDKTKTILENIDATDAIIKDTYKYDTMFNIVGNWITPGSSKTISSIEEQQLMERLAHNDLFTSSARLKSL